MDEYVDEKGFLTEKDGKPIQDKAKGENYRQLMIRYLAWDSKNKGSNAANKLISGQGAVEHDYYKDHLAKNGNGGERSVRVKDNGRVADVRDAAEIKEKVKKTVGLNESLHIGQHSEVWGNFHNIQYALLSKGDEILICGKISENLSGPLNFTGRVTNLSGKTRKRIGIKSKGAGSTFSIIAMFLVKGDKPKIGSIALRGDIFLDVLDVEIQGIVSGVSGDISKIWNDVSNLRFGVNPTDWFGDVLGVSSIPVLENGQEDPEAQAWMKEKYEEEFLRSGEYPSRIVIENGNRFSEPVYPELGGVKLYRKAIFLCSSLQRSKEDNASLRPESLPKRKFKTVTEGGVIFFLTELDGIVVKKTKIHDFEKKSGVYEQILERQGIVIPIKRRMQVKFEKVGSPVIETPRAEPKSPSPEFLKPEGSRQLFPQSMKGLLSRVKDHPLVERARR